MRKSFDAENSLQPSVGLARKRPTRGWIPNLQISSPLKHLYLANAILQGYLGINKLFLKLARGGSEKSLTLDFRMENAQKKMTPALSASGEMDSSNGYRYTRRSWIINN
jgi:hypothetical protein